MDKFITESQLDALSDSIAGIISGIAPQIVFSPIPYTPREGEGPVSTGEVGYFRVGERVYAFPVVNFEPLINKIGNNNIITKQLIPRYNYSERSESDILEDYHTNHIFYLNYRSLKDGILEYNIFNMFRNKDNYQYKYPEIGFQISEDYIDKKGRKYKPELYIFSKIKISDRLNPEVDFELVPTSGTNPFSTMGRYRIRDEFIDHIYNMSNININLTSSSELYAETLDGEMVRFYPDFNLAMKMQPKYDVYYNIDLARVYVPVEKVIEGVSKLGELGVTHLNLHVSDNEAHRLDGPLINDNFDTIPNTYSAEDYNNIIKAFKEGGGVGVILEVGTPNHMKALLETFKQYEGRFGVPKVGNDYNELRYIEQEIIDYMKEFYSRLISKIPDLYGIHLGGDESWAAMVQEGNHEVISHYNQLISHIKDRNRDINLYLWNDPVHLEALETLDKRIKIMYWAWDGDKSDKREELTSFVAGMDDLVEAGFEVINGNHKFLNINIVESEGESGFNDRERHLQDAVLKFSPEQWDSDNEIPEDRKVDPRSISGLVFSAWNSDAGDIFNAYKIKSIAEIVTSALKSQRIIAL